jgi:hypothetical protein
MSHAFPRLVSVEPQPGLRLAFRLEGDRRRHAVDLTGIINRTAVLRPLLEPERFKLASIVDDGIGVAWSPEDDPDRLDLSAQTLVLLMQLQAPMTGQDFREWRQHLGLSRSETSAVLGIAVRTVTDYQGAAQVPAVVALACRALKEDRYLLHARYRPSAPAGRPRKKQENREAVAEAGRLVRKLRSNTPADRQRRRA